jgi:serine/threonine-protein kinase
MELLEGTTLAQRIRDAGRLSPMEAATLVLQLLDGLAAAHAAAIVHRDLKPANIFLAEGGAYELVKILDFGVSKFMGGAEDLAATGGGLVLGTPFYMSPEQAKGADAIDHRSDLYAVGVILYECVTGKVPYQAKTLNELIFRIVLEAPPPLSSVVPDLDPAFVAIVEKAMAREAGERFQTAREMHEALSAWLTSDGTGARVGVDTADLMLWATAPNRQRRTGERAFVLGLLSTVVLGGATLFSVRPPLTTGAAAVPLAPMARPAELGDTPKPPAKLGDAPKPPAHATASASPSASAPVLTPALVDIRGSAGTGMAPGARSARPATSGGDIPNPPHLRGALSRSAP